MTAPPAETRPAAAALPAHHRPGGGFRNPWPTANGDRLPSVLRWWWERLGTELPPDPRPAQLPRAAPDPRRPRAAPAELTATWLGHSTFLLQIGGLNLLTDPQLGDRASPLAALGPRRFTPAGMTADELPPLDAVLVSHDHYDHLDDHTVRRLTGRSDHDPTWFVPLGLGAWMRRRGARAVVEMDWGDTATTGGVEIQFLPAQHWSSRSPVDRFRRLWGSWGARSATGRSLYFGGDSGWFPGYPEIAATAGPFDLILLPVGAYEPRWFMQPAHMNPEEAVRAYGELGAGAVLGAMHWGTFRLTDEDPLEPPRRTRAAWSSAGYFESRLWIPAIGETRIIE